MTEILEVFIKKGKLLQESTKEISNTIKDSLLTNTTSQRPKYFYFVDASSGMGKSQLAASIAPPVVYIPLVTNQPVYQCFYWVSNRVIKALKKDAHNSKELFKLSATELADRDEQFHTVGLLLSLYKIVQNKSNEESLKILSGYQQELTLQYDPMSLEEARAELLKQAPATLDSSSSSSNSSSSSSSGVDNIPPLFFIDEVPNIANTELYNLCILLRNFLRCMQCVCLLAGTEASAMNSIDSVATGSRLVEGAEKVEYMRLLITLPPTNWQIFETDAEYADIIKSVKCRVRAMLKRTRPLFVEYTLKAMKEHSKHKLTAKVLQTVREKILKSKVHFISADGLYAQVALIHSAFVSPNPIEKKRKHGEIDNLQNELDADEFVCVRHHFGRMHIPHEPNIGPALSLFVSDDARFPEPYLAVNTPRGLMRFRPGVGFSQPHCDELLYLACFRDGLAHGSENISTSYGLRTVYRNINKRKTSLFINSLQPSCSGRFLESEVVSAAIIASHSQAKVSGCRLSTFLRSLVAELNVNEQRVGRSQFELEGMPLHYDEIKIGLLSPANASWQPAGQASPTLSAQGKSICFTDFTWGANKNRNDGAFPVIYEAETPCAKILSLEAKCYADTTPTEQFTKTINNCRTNNHLITIMVVTNAAKPREGGNAQFEEAKKGMNIVRITGNAMENHGEVATKLTWEGLHTDNPQSPDRTVVQIVLESIYPGRYKQMKRIYTST